MVDVEMLLPGTGPECGKEYLGTPVATAHDRQSRQARTSPLRICSYSVVMHIDDQLNPLETPGW